MSDIQGSFEDPQTPPAQVEVKKVKPSKIWKQMDEATYLKKLAAQSDAQAKVKANQLKPLTEEEWAAMNGKARWDSIVALRGPDLVHSSNLKWFTSSVLRYRMSGIMRVGGLVNNIMPFVVLPGDLFEGSGNFDSSHFLGHISEAAEWLNVPRAIVPAETFWEAVSPRHHYYAAEKLIYPKLLAPYQGLMAQILLARGESLPGGASCQE